MYIDMLLFYIKTLHYLASRSASISSQQISLSAEESYDPDNFTQNLRFTWYCRDTKLEARDIFSIPNIPVINSTYLIFQKVLQRLIALSFQNSYS